MSLYGAVSQSLHNVRRLNCEVYLADGWFFQSIVTRELATSKSEWVKYNCCLLLANERKLDDLVGLKSALDDDCEVVRWAAALALWKHLDPNVRRNASGQTEPATLDRFIAEDGLLQCLEQRGFEDDCLRPFCEQFVQRVRQLEEL